MDDGYPVYAGVKGINWSTLREMNVSPQHYRWRLDNPPEETPSMTLGRAIHTAVLEPDRFPLDYVVWDGGRKAGQAYEDFKAVNAGRTILKLEEYEQALAIRDAVRSHRDARRYLRRGKPEQTLTWVDAATGLPCKARLDWLAPRWLLELKSTRSIDEREWRNTVTYSLYYGQLAFYRMGLRAQHPRRKAPAVKLIAVENCAPYEVVVFDVPDEVLDAGEDLAASLLARVKECRARKSWPGRYSGEQTLSLPGWAYPPIDPDAVDPDDIITILKGASRERA